MIVIFLLLLVVGGLLILVCVLRAKAAKKEVREATDRVYDAIEEREVMATRKNEAYGHIGGHIGGEGRGRWGKSSKEMPTGEDREYEEVC